MLKRRFTEVAENYDDLKLAFPHYDEIQQKTGALLITNLTNSFPKNEFFMILEMGCGTGETTEKVLSAANEARIDIHIIAIDNEPKMLEAAQNKIKNPNVSFIMSEAGEFLDTQKAPYDGIISGFMLHNLKKKQRAGIITKALQILEPKGVFVNLDKIARNDSVLHLKDLDEQLRTLDVFRKNSEKFWAYWYQHYLDDDKIKMTEAEIESLLGADGRKVEFLERHVMDEICIAVRE